MSYTLQFLGVGSAFGANGNYHSNMLLTAPSGEKLLIDCGSDIRFALRDVGLNYADIKNVYISHLHADHIGGLEGLALSSYFNPNCQKPQLYLNAKLIERLWSSSLSGGLATLEELKADLNTYFVINGVAENSSFIWEGLDLYLIPTIHVLNGGEIMPCCGLFFTINNRNVYISADTQYRPEALQEYYDKADIIFHDCETSDSPPSGVHAPFYLLKELDSAIKQKMWLYHYNPGELPDAVNNGFRGFVSQGQVFDL